MAKITFYCHAYSRHEVPSSVLLLLKRPSGSYTLLKASLFGANMVYAADASATFRSLLSRIIQLISNLSAITRVFSTLSVCVLFWVALIKQSVTFGHK